MEDLLQFFKEWIMWGGFKEWKEMLFGPIYSPDGNEIVSIEEETAHDEEKDIITKVYYPYFDTEPKKKKKKKIYWYVKKELIKKLAEAKVRFSVRLENISHSHFFSERIESYYQKLVTEIDELNEGVKENIESRYRDYFLKALNLMRDEVKRHSENLNGIAKNPGIKGYTEEDIRALADKVQSVLKEVPSSATATEEKKADAINSDKFDAFRAIEDKLIEKEFLTNNREWKAAKPKLAALICFLDEYNYLLKKYKGKTGKAALIEYRRFFEERYKTKIKTEFEPARRKNFKKFASDFCLIIPELKLPD